MSHIPEQLEFKQKVKAIGGAKIRKNAQLTGGSGPYTDLSNDVEITVAKSQSLAPLQDMYMVCDIKNTNATPINFQGRGGTTCIFESVYASVNSGNLSGFANQNVLFPIELSKNAEVQYLASVGNQLFGTSGSDIAGTAIPAGGTIRQVIPFSLSNVFGDMPLWSDENITLRCKIADARNVYVGATVVAGSVEYTNCQVFYYTIPIPDEIFKPYYNAMNGKFVKSGTDWSTTSVTILAETTEQTISIPFNRKSVKRVVACLRSTANLLAQTKVSLCSRNKAFMTEAKLLLNGDLIPQTSFKTSAASSSEMMAELMIGNGGLLNLNPNCLNSSGINFNLAEGTADTNVQCGQFFFEFNLTNTLEDDVKTYSGLVVDSNNFSLMLTGLGPDLDQRCDVFVEYGVDYILENGVWSVKY